MWLLEKNIFDRMKAAEEKGLVPSAKEEDEYAASVEIGAVDGELPRIMSVAGNSAAIKVDGVLTNKPSLFARWFGGGNTTYREIRSALAVAEADDSIKEIVFLFGSPGGLASSEWIEAMDAVAKAKKPTRAIVETMAASAAYGLASQTDKIQAQNRLSMVGSIGVVASYYLDDKVVDITSTNAPKKRPDVSTEEGKKVVRERLDRIESIFIDSVANGRGVAKEKVLADFGNGDVVLAADAVALGMIDSVLSQTETQKTTAVHGGAKKEFGMDLNKLKADHPAVYQAVVDEGIKQGVAKERDRVNAHLILGKGSGDMETAMAAIEDGSDMTATIQAKYMAAGMNKNDMQNRADDETETSDAADSTGATEESDSEEKAVVDGVVSKLGGE